ncbi:helix-turn-helix transcriptional regulator [Sphingobium nicotianae]|uniref:Helix-turn-helix transcriptional regulator n=1 Tax=Sphingobium nicotianae TaxID=2782607 RepID=A0A9X1DE68_9SPHN|nr:helix-turn-helix transcriptional regulator [Sphingobium nicotianae]MBT2188287.1 helix-turn-helix transcriptional regulator [Sphingobium nicotianae]
MTTIQQIRDWRAPTTMCATYEKLLAAIGTQEFGSTVRDSVFSVTSGARRLYLFEASGRIDNCLVYSCCEPGLAELFPLYEKNYLPLDPVQDAYRAAPTCSDLVFQRILPSDIASAGFRRRFFDEPGIIERISIVQRGAERWRGMNIARHASDGYFSEGELSSLIDLACLTLPMLPVNREKADGAVRQLNVGQIEERFATRYGSLTPRERQVCARAAIGMTVEATALDLGIAKTSVLTYRQRAYQRLRVSSPYQLCSLVSH